MLSLFPGKFQDRLVAVTFNRWGGVSSAPYHELNVGFRVGDDPQAVTENRGKIAGAIGCLSLVSSVQVHGDRIDLITDHMGGSISRDAIKGADGLLTKKRGVALMIQHADCQSVVLFDPVRGAIGNIHCGWRGSVLNIIGKAVAAMARHFGSRPGDIWAGISPSIGPCCAEFKGWRGVLPDEFLSFKTVGDRFDFWAITKAQLMAAGVHAEKIFMSKICNFCKNDYYSYRREKKTGRCATVAVLV
ncbi:MAG: peptidoglycan editing factor PgeF [Dissulfurimicrobium sp.]|uniref:peptidoglycan editing factor PgeF n=1 Tax=Dissulfurimicrobium hydrothermale TaxID=1750598 RepID=UPI001EDA46E4|nr:peptidoglycan editing factor PgeF [Dissulfurimicrobium hydrothermale]UKL13531.1 peptidoglycan editing factor PgeF [Dissulfurimicrobium hydrothermale]